MSAPLALSVNPMQDPLQGKGPPPLRTVFLPQTSRNSPTDTHRRCAPGVPLLNPVRLVKEIVHSVYIELNAHACMKVGVCE